MKDVQVRLEAINDELIGLFILEHGRGFDEGYDKGYNEGQRSVTDVDNVDQKFEVGITAAWTLLNKLLYMDEDKLLKLTSDDNYYQGIDLLKEVTNYGYYHVKEKLEQLECAAQDVKVGDDVYIDVPEIKYVVVYKDTLESKAYLINKEGITSTAPLDMVHPTGNFLDVKQFVSKFITG